MRILILAVCTSMFVSCVSASELIGGEGIGKNLKSKGEEDLSGAFYDGTNLWLVSNGNGDVWKAPITKSLSGITANWDLDTPIKWDIKAKGDYEAITKMANSDSNVLMILNEGKSRRLFKKGVPASIEKFEFHESPLSVEEGDTWELPKYMKPNGRRGAEGLAWIPDDAYSELHSTDEEGNVCNIDCPKKPVTALSGLFLVAHQDGGEVYAFWLLDDADKSVVFYGKYRTGASESSGLEYDKDNEQLLIWHGGKLKKKGPSKGVNMLEIAELELESNKAGQPTNKLKSIDLYQYPNKVAKIRESHNLEGVAWDAKSRQLFLTADDGKNPFTLITIPVP